MICTVVVLTLSGSTNPAPRQGNEPSVVDAIRDEFSLSTRENAQRLFVCSTLMAGLARYRPTSLEVAKLMLRIRWHTVKDILRGSRVDRGHHILPCWKGLEPCPQDDSMHHTVAALFVLTRALFRTLLCSLVLCPCQVHTMLCRIKNHVRFLSLVRLC